MSHLPHRPRLVVAALDTAYAGRGEQIARALLDAGHEVVLVQGATTASGCVATVEQEDAELLVLLVSGPGGAEVASGVLDLMADHGVGLVVAGIADDEATPLERRGAVVLGADSPASEVASRVAAHLR